MISESDRQHGAVLRQLLVECGVVATIQPIDDLGRVDTFLFNGAAFHIRHSGKRLSPWQFTLMADSLAQLRNMCSRNPNSWIFLVCGIDGIVGLQMSEVSVLIEIDSAATEWLRVSRSKNAMYRVSGSLGELGRAVPMGVARFLSSCNPSTAEQ